MSRIIIKKGFLMVFLTVFSRDLKKKGCVDVAGKKPTTLVTPLFVMRYCPTLVDRIGRETERERERDEHYVCFSHFFPITCQSN